MSFSLIPFILISGMLFLVTTPIQGENIQINQSFSSSQAQDQKLASATSSSQKNSSNSSQKVNCTPTNTPASTEKLQTYTNPSYPNLKINYDNSWKMEIKDNQTPYYKNLLEREIILNKNDSKLIFSLFPVTGMGGLEMGDNGYYTKTEIGREGLWRWKSNTLFGQSTSANNYFYASNRRRTGTISTSILVKDNPDYHNQKSEFVTYFIMITVQSDNEIILKEADQIVANSSFGTF